MPWQERQPGVYDCLWGTDTVRVVVAGELPRQPHNAPLHLFSASPELVGFGGRTYRRRSEDTSRLLVQLFESLRAEDFSMAYTMADFRRDFMREHFLKLTPQEQQDVLQALPGRGAAGRTAGGGAAGRTAGGGAARRTVRGANPPVSGPEDRQPQSPFAQTASEEVTERDPLVRRRLERSSALVRGHADCHQAPAVRKVPSPNPEQKPELDKP